MHARLRRWSRKKRTAFLIGVALSSAVVQYGVVALTDSRPTRLLVDVALIFVLGWITITWFRVLLRESAEEASRNPRPW